MKRILAIDTFILNRCEAFSHFMQKTFGTKSADLERACLVLATALVVLHMVTMSYPKFLPIRVLLIGANIFIMLGLLGRIHLSYKYDWVKDELQRLGMANSTKVRMAWPRMALLPFTLFLLASDQEWWAFSYLALYFNACDDLPPGVSRVRKLVESLKASLRPAVVT